MLLFFLLAVLPQFASVFRDFNAKLDPTLAAFLALSEALRAHFDAVAVTLAAILAGRSCRPAPAVGARRLRPRLRPPAVRRASSSNSGRRRCFAATSR